jgi:hypothetical protein
MRSGERDGKVGKSKGMGRRRKNCDRTYEVSNWPSRDISQELVPNTYKQGLSIHIRSLRSEKQNSSR